MSDAPTEWLPVDLEVVFRHRQPTVTAMQTQPTTRVPASPLPVQPGIGQSDGKKSFFCSTQTDNVRPVTYKRVRGNGQINRRNKSSVNSHSVGLRRNRKQYSSAGEYSSDSETELDELGIRQGR